MKSLHDRFWEKVKVGKPDECWEWLGRKDQDGYGWAMRGQRAHRLIYIWSNGPIPAGMEICHSCDVRSCVNPWHLSLGTHQENVAQCVARGRQAYGSRAGTAKLLEDQIPQIRAWLAAGLSCRAIGRRLGVTHGPISQIKRNVAWAHVK